MRAVNNVTNVIQSANIKPLQQNLLKTNFVKTAPLQNDVFIKSNQTSKAMQNVGWKHSH